MKIVRDGEWEHDCRKVILDWEQARDGARQGKALPGTVLECDCGRHWVRRNKVGFWRSILFVPHICARGGGWGGPWWVRTWGGGRGWKPSK